MLICIIGTHRKTTGKPLEDHWKHTGISPVAFQCTLGSKFQAHWIATGLPLEDHWLRVRAGIGIVKYKHTMWILEPNYIFHVPIVVIFVGLPVGEQSTDNSVRHFRPFQCFLKKIDGCSEILRAHTIEFISYYTMSHNPYNGRFSTLCACLSFLYISTQSLRGGFQECIAEWDMKSTPWVK